MNSSIRHVAVLAGVLLVFGVSPVRGQEAPEKLTLKRAVTLALENSRELALARVRYNVALNEAGVNRAEFRPNLFTGSGAAYTNGFPQTPGGAAPSVFELSYTQALFNPLLRGELRASEDRAKNQRLELDRMRDRVMVRVATAYLELANVRHSLELLRTERTSTQKILEVTKQRAGAGLELPLEVTREELAGARIEERIVHLEGRDRILSDQIRDLTGFPAGQPIQVEAEELPVGPEQSAEELVGLALQSSSQVKEAENERSAREHLLKGARGAYWPTVDLVGQYSVLSRINNYDQFFRKFQRNNLNLGLEIRIPIFSAKTSANAALARSQLAAAELELGSARRDARLDAEQKIRDLRERDAAREVARLDLKLAQEMLQAVQAKFDQGRASLRDLEQARLDESEKWVAFLDADFAGQRAQLALLEATGQLARMFR